MRDGSYVEMKSDTIEMMCDEALENIDDERKKRKENLIRETIESKNSGFWGMVRRWFGRSFDREKAIRYLKADSWDDYNLIDIDYERDRRDIRMIATMICYNDVIYLSKEDLRTILRWNVKGPV
jgi:hypothetical protein